MNTIENDRVAELFEIAIGFGPTDRLRIVKKHANGDQQLETEVLRLLALNEQASRHGFMDVETAIASGTIHDEGPTENDPYIGTELGVFYVRHLLAIGGMGRIYVGSRTDGIEQDVAIKVLRDVHADNRSFRMFGREQQVLAKLSHPSIASLIDRGFTCSGQPYFVMPLVKGERIDRYCEQAELTAKQTAEMVFKVCQAIEHAHQQKVVHCDIKPSNVLVSHNAIPVVTDFGLARFIEMGEGETMTRSPAGTPGYMAPEQLGGERSQLDVRADVYGIGAMLYAILTGRPPYKGNGFVETLALVRESELVPVRKLAPKTPRDLETICHKCLEKKPGNRYQSVSLLAADLERFLHDEPVLARPISKLEMAIRWADRNRLSAGLVVFLIALTIAGLVVTTSLWRIAENRLEISEKKTAEANQLLKLTFEQAEDFYTQLAIELRDEPGAEEFRRSLLESALKMYQELAELDSDNPETRHLLGRAHWYIGKSLKSAHEFDERDRAINKALEIFSELAIEFPDEHRHRFDMFNCLIELNQWDAAFKLIEELVKLEVEQPERRFYRVAYALGLLKKAELSLIAGELENVLELTDQSMAISQDLIDRYGESYRDDEEDVMIVFRKNIAKCHHVQANLNLTLGQMKRARESAKSAIEEGLVYEALFENHEGHVLPILSSAVEIAYFSGDPNLAFQWSDRLLEFVNEFIQDRPEQAIPYNWKAVVLNQRGSLFELEDEQQLANQEYAMALNVHRQLFNQAPNSLDQRTRYANNLASLPAPMLENPQEIVDMAEEVPWGLRIHYRNECLAMAHLRLNQPDVALEFFEKCSTANSPLFVYKALALAELGRDQEAREILDLKKTPFIGMGKVKRAAIESRAKKELKALPKNLQNSD